jgi:hypothetical protein
VGANNPKGGLIVNIIYLATWTLHNALGKALKIILEKLNRGGSFG